MNSNLHLNKYLNDKTIIASLISKAVKEALVSVNREDLFAEILSFKMERNTVYLKTGKPIVNAELNCHNSIIREKIAEILLRFGLNISNIVIIWK